MDRCFYGIDLIDMIRKDNGLLFRNSKITKSIHLVTIFEFIQISNFNLNEFNVAYIITADYKNIRKKLKKLIKAINKSKIEYLCFDTNICMKSGEFSWEIFMDLWCVVSKVIEEGYAREIGLCNCNIDILNFLQKRGIGLPKLCLQAISLKNQQLDFVKKCNDIKINVLSFTMLDGCMNEIRILEYLSEKYGVEVNAICRAWLQQQNIKYIVQNPIILQIITKQTQKRKKKNDNKKNMCRQTEKRKINEYDIKEKLLSDITYEQIDAKDWYCIENLNDDFFNVIFPKFELDF